jgi:hypothetical protein
MSKKVNNCLKIVSSQKRWGSRGVSIDSSRTQSPMCFLDALKKDNLIERPDQGHLYPLRRRRDKHVTGGARTSAPLKSRPTHYLKSYLDSLLLAIRNLYLRRNGRPPHSVALNKKKHISAFSAKKHGVIFT